MSWFFREESHERLVSTFPPMKILLTPPQKETLEGIPLQVVDRSSENFRPIGHVIHCRVRLRERGGRGL